ncbi:MAG TPA: potassium-transporting ATPase subunit KdpC [Candidatus Angelobacter sp.]|jgi:K+-transporting ATPase ATPase C chain
MLKQLAPALKMTILLTVLTGLIYPTVITGLCQVLFKTQANGSLVVQNGQVIGSSLLAQNFTRPEYFHPRPSAAGSDGYDPTASSGSNLGPTSQKLFDRVKASAEQFRKENSDYAGPIPADALTASGSGLDPQISIANANAQAARVAKARGASTSTIENLIASATEGRDLGFLGEPRVNVLKLNLELDRQAPKH